LGKLWRWIGGIDRRPRSCWRMSDSWKIKRSRRWSNNYNWTAVDETTMAEW
jgi:hypothetical protein